MSPVSVYLGISVSSLIDGILRNVTPFSKLHSWVLPRMLVLSANLCKAGKAGTVTQYDYEFISEHRGVEILPDRQRRERHKDTADSRTRLKALI